MAAEIRQVATPNGQWAKKQPIDLIGRSRQIGTSKALVALTLLGAFLAFYIAMILAWEDFAFYDNDMFTQYTLRGQDFPMPVWPAAGRFFPFGQQEYNLIRHFTDTPAGYHVLPIAQLLFFSSILLVLDDELSIVARAALAIVALLTPSILISFSLLIVPERNVLFFLACLALSIKKFEHTKSIAWAVAAVISAQFMIYFKETAFLLLLGFAAGKLILRCRNKYDAGWDFGRLWDRESRLDFCLAFLAVAFLAQYFAFIGIHGDRGYAVEHRLPLSVIVFAYLRWDLLSWLFMAVVIGRFYLILRRRVTPSLLWDGLALGGAACFLGYIGLRLFGSYYLAPVDLIAILYIGQFAALGWNKLASRSKLAALLIGSAILAQDLAFSAFSVFERKNVIRAKAEIASVVEARYRSGAGNVRRLYFPFATHYMIEEFADYLEYRGVPVERAEGQGGRPNSVAMVSTSPADGSGYCGWCRMADGSASGVVAPDPGDLVIVLPEDEASRAEASAYRKRGDLLLSYDPRPPLPQMLHSLYVSPYGYRAKLPDRWMDASVTLWK